MHLAIILWCFMLQYICSVLRLFPSHKIRLTHLGSYVEVCRVSLRLLKYQMCLQMEQYQIVQLEIPIREVASSPIHKQEFMVRMPIFYSRSILGLKLTILQVWLLREAAPFLGNSDILATSSRILIERTFVFLLNWMTHIIHSIEATRKKAK